MIIQPDEEIVDFDEIPSEEAKQKVVDNEESSKLPAVAAQIEVLYDVEETLFVPADAGEENQETVNKSECIDLAEAKTVTRKSVVVGVFEGWLSGDPQGLLWRVADLRFPVEFPFLTRGGLNE